MTDRREPTATAVVAAATAALDQAEAELRNLRAHVARINPADPGHAFTAARSAAIIAGITGEVAQRLRDLDARQGLKKVS